MGLMAPQTIPGRWLMRLLFTHLGFQFFMAIQAEIRTGCQKQAFQFCLVGAVAIGTFSHQDRVMLGLPSLDSLFKLRVAGKAQGTLFIHDHPLNIAPVGIVTRKTFTFRKRVVVGAARLRLHQITMALGAHFRAR